MKVFTESMELPNILHFQGRSEVMDKFFKDGTNSLIGLKFEEWPDDLTVITTFTDKSKSPLVQQLENNGCPYLNSYKEEWGDFVMTNKVEYIITALAEVKTSKVLILDGYDVLIQNPVGLLDNFNHYNTRILWNASINNYPNTVVDKMAWRDYIGRWNHFNAGCCIGYTKDVLDFYLAAKSVKDSDTFDNPFGSEQFILRHVWKRYTDDMLLPRTYTNIDYKCKVFMALSQVYVTAIDVENTTWIGH